MRISNHPQLHLDAILTLHVGECKPKEYPPWEHLIKRPKQPENRYAFD